MSTGTRWGLSVALLLVGCSDPPAEEADAKQAATDEKKAAEAPAGDAVEVVADEKPLEIGVTVLEAGKPAAAPLSAPSEIGVARPLRIAFSAVRVAKKKKRPMLFPTVEITAMHTREAANKGKLQLNTVVLGPGPGVDEAAAAAVAKEATLGWAAFEVSPLGDIKTMNWPAAASQKGTADLGGVARHTLSHLSLPVPTDTIGKGGKWAVKRPIEVLGVQTVQTVRVKLTKVFGAQVEVEGKVFYEGDVNGDGSFFARMHLPSGTPIEMHVKGTLRFADRTVKFDARIDENYLALADSRVKFSGKFTQGGLVQGAVAPKTKVWLNKERVKVSKEGDFLLAFGRDARPRARVGFQFPGGEIERHIVPVADRKFEPEEINGLPDEMVNYGKETKKALAQSRKKIGKLRKKSSNHTFFKEGWQWPMSGRITSTYGRKRILNGKDKGFHWGLDIAGRGKKVRAPAPGVVVFAESDVPLSGTLLILDHGHGLTSSFLHLQKITVKVGDTVKAGQVVAKSGNTGRSTGPHLDWRMNLHETRIDPQLLLPAR